jgi:transcriptional regulator with XRE-family HTH domain
MSRRRVTGGLGEVVRSRRQVLGMSQTELAGKVGVTQTYISNMELDRVQLPNVEIRRNLAEALRMSHLELLMAIGEIQASEVPGAAAVRPVIYGVLELLDSLPPRQQACRGAGDSGCGCRSRRRGRH